MKIEFINRVIVITSAIAVLYLLGSALFGLPQGFSVFLGATWGIANLLILKNLIRDLLTPLANPKIGKNYSRIFLLIIVKGPLLYYAGYRLIKTKSLSPLHLLMGFSLIFAVIIIFVLWKGLTTKTEISDQR